MWNWLFGTAVTTTLAFLGLYLQFLLKQANEIKGLMRKVKTVVRLIFVTYGGTVAGPTRHQLEQWLPWLPGARLVRQLRMVRRCLLNRIRRAWIRCLSLPRRLPWVSEPANGLERLLVRCIHRMAPWVFEERSLPPKLHRYECCQTFLVFDAVRELHVDDVQIGWFVAPSARNAALQFARTFPVDSADLVSLARDRGSAWRDTFVYASERYLIWARPMSGRAQRREAGRGN